MSRLRNLHDADVSIWLDSLSRDLLDGGAFARLIDDCWVTGATSNPTIFAAAISGSERYDAQLQHLVRAGIDDPQELFFALALDDVGRAADLLLGVHQLSGGRDGFVSFECTPDLADDTDATVAQALELWERLSRPNVMIKVPATAAGIAAIEELTYLGVNVNVTLLFSLERYEQSVEAYLAGLERRRAAGSPLSQVTSVASLFVSRLDGKADALLPAGSPLAGKIAVANALTVYAAYTERFSGERWQALEQAGARRQRPLWASTATKNPAYSDLLYVEELVTPGAINTMPLSTLRAFTDHGTPARPADPRKTLQAARSQLDLAAIADELEQEGVQAFRASYRQVLELLDAKAAKARSGKELAAPDANAHGNALTGHSTDNQIGAV